MSAIAAFRYLVRNPIAAVTGPVWYCPICDRHGRFVPFNYRLHARCWHCGSLERHRLLWYALHQIISDHSWRVLHVAPERCLRQRLSEQFDEYITGDLERRDVTMRGLDLCRMPCGDGALDMVIASHVLEHIEDDGRAIREIHRVLKPGGIAILPVPWAAGPTIEFDAPRAEADEDGHWRRPGLDYLDRYREWFEVETITSDDVPEQWQARIHRIRATADWLPYEILPLCKKAA